MRDYVVLGRAAHLGVFDKPSEADFALVDEALKKLGISHFADRIYMQMSGGEKQLVNLARILVQQPQLILFDEPTSALDYGNVFKTLSLIKELSLQGFTIIMTTHNPDHPMLLHSALPHSRVTILNEHGKLQTGAAPEIITEANLKALYQTDLRLTDCLYPMRKTEARRFRFLSNTPGRSRCRTARPRWDSVSFRQPTSFREIAATVTDSTDSTIIGP